jgi:GT2 family glycosyltransferase
MTGCNATSMPISREDLEDVGLLDEGLFLYWEDTEFSLCLRKKGWRIGAAPESRILHKVSASTSGNKGLLDRYQTASDLRLLGLHFPCSSPVVAYVPWYSLCPTHRALAVSSLQQRGCRDSRLSSHLAHAWWHMLIWHTDDMQS